MIHIGNTVIEASYTNMINLDLKNIDEVTKKWPPSALAKYSEEEKEELNRSIQTVNNIFTLFMNALPPVVGGLRVREAMQAALQNLNLIERKLVYERIPNFLNKSTIEALVRTARRFFVERDITKELADESLVKNITYQHPQCDLVVEDFVPGYSSAVPGYYTSARCCLAVGYEREYEGQQVFLPLINGNPFLYYSSNLQSYALIPLRLINSIWMRFELLQIPRKDESSNIEWIRIQEVNQDTLLSENNEEIDKTAVASLPTGIYDFLAKKLMPVAGLPKVIATLVAKYAINPPQTSYYAPTRYPIPHIYDFPPSYMTYDQVQKIASSCQKVTVEQALNYYCMSLRSGWESAIGRSISPEEISKFITSCFSAEERQKLAVSNHGAHNRWGVVFPCQTLSTPTINIFRQVHGWPHADSITYLLWGQPNSQNARVYPAHSYTRTDISRREIRGFVSTNNAIRFEVGLGYIGDFYNINEEPALDTTKQFAEFPRDPYSHP